VQLITGEKRRKKGEKAGADSEDFLHEG